MYGVQNLEVLIQEYDGFTVNVPELKLLRQYQKDAFHWISRFNKIVKNNNEREDPESVVDELICLEKDGSLLKVQGLHLAYSHVFHMNHITVIAVMFVYIGYMVILFA